MKSIYETREQRPCIEVEKVTLWFFSLRCVNVEFAASETVTVFQNFLKNGLRRRRGSENCADAIFP